MGNPHILPCVPGTRYGKLTLIERIDRNAARGQLCLFRCDCGNSIEWYLREVRNATLASCGCEVGHGGRTHGLSREHRLTYKTWEGMRARCLNPDHNSYQYYGGRGVTIYPDWLDFSKFLRDVGDRPSKGHSLDRYPNPDGNYEPLNVRWATAKEQGENRRNSIIITLDGESLTAMQWSKRLNIPYARIVQRVKRGHSPEKSLSIHNVRPSLSLASEIGKKGAAARWKHKREPAKT